MTGPRVHLYAACWNEADNIDFFFRHYDPWIERYFVFDDGSTDGSLEMLSSHPRVEVHELVRTHPDSLILSLRDLYNNAWKRSRGRADWVVVVNLDEHLYHPDIRRYLAECRGAGVTAIPALGYQMLAGRRPPPGSALAESVRLGVPWGLMNKLALFNPDEIDEVDYVVGRHAAAPTGRVVYPERDELRNLHFKYLGLDDVLRRHAAQSVRLGRRDRDEGWGHRYLETPEGTKRWLDGLAARAIEPLAAGSDPHCDHRARRWWRD